MKSDPDSVRTLLGELGEAPVPLDTPEREAQRRARVVSHIHKEMGRAEGASRRPPRVAWLSVAAILLFAFAGWAAVRSQGEPSAPQLVDAPQAQQAPGGTRLTTRGEVSIDSKPAADGALGLDQVVSVGEQAEAALVLPSDARVSAGAASTLWVASLGARESVYLKSGFVNVEVPKLAAGHGFSVLTPLGEVAVHGTKFSVRVTDDPPSLSVDVREGIVSVRNGGEEHRLVRGESWTSPTSSAAAPSASAGTAPVADDVVPGEASANPRGKPGTPQSEAAKSTLAQENALFRQAVGAERSGNKRGALALFDQLLRKYPKSPLAPDARVRRFRILKELGDADEAAKEARRYMAEHPEGFAHDEARDVAGQSLKGEPQKKK